MIEELKTFIAVVENESFTKAGEVVNISQPSVSVHIKNLEYYFGVELIKRSVKQKNIIITDCGHLLYRKAKEIIRLLETTKEEVKNVSTSVKGNIKIGASYTIGEYFLPKFISDFCKEYEDVHIELVIENTATICEMVKELKLDCGLIEGSASSYDFKQGYFSEDKIVLMVPKDHSLMLEEFSYEKLQNQKWITRENGSGTREYLNMFLTTNEVIPKSIMVFGSNYSVKEAVKNGLGITLISDYVAKAAVRDNEVAIVELNKEYKRKFSYILPNDISVSNITKLFLDKLLSL